MPPTIRRYFLASLSALALVTGAASGADIRLGEKVVPTFQAIELKLDADRADYSGSVRVELDVREPTDHVRLHSETQEITRLALRGSGGEVDLRHEKETDEILSLRTAEPLAKGAYTLEIDFTSPFGTQAVGLYRTEQDGAGYAFTQFEADDAREAFPCWDEPSFKHPYQMTLIVPEGHLAVTNTAVESDTTKDGWRTMVFEKTRPLPSYLLAIATGTLETVDVPGLSIPSRIVTVKGQSHLAEVASQMTAPLLEALEDYFGTRHPYDKLDQIAVPEFWPGGMENAGAITYADGLLLVDPATVSIGRRRGMAGVIAHELAHQWFGDLVTMEWWDDLWLNEAFADWMADKISHQVFPELNIDVTAVQSTQSIMGTDARATTEPVRKRILSAKEAIRGLGITYVKGSAVLGMFEQWLGAEDFRRGVKAYLKAHEWGNASADDLWRSLDQASGKPVSKALATFIEQPGVPRVAVEVQGDGRVRLTQERFRNYGSTSSDFTWKIPVTLKYPKSDSMATHTLLFDSASVTVDLGLGEGERPAWVYPNAEGRGYYRWKVAPEMLGRLAADAASVLTPRERIELLGNVAALLDAGEIDGGEYLGIVSSLADDPHLLVVRSVMSELGSVETAFVRPELDDAFAAYVKRTLGPVLERIGVEKRPGEDEAAALVRPALFGWLGDTGGDASLRRHAEKLARAFMADPTSVDPGLVSVAMGLMVKSGDRALFDKLRKRFESAATPLERQRYLGALAGFDDPDIRREALRYALEGPLRPNEIFRISVGMMDTPAGRDRIFDWLTENFEAIMKRIPPLFLAQLTSIAGGCSAERLERGRAFFAEHDGPGVAQQLEKVAEQVRDCVGLREREGEAVARYLLSAR